LIEETVWLGDIPVGTLRSSGSGVSIYYIHSDQLNTPRQVTRPSDNTALWTWNSDPFGTDAANANPAGAGAFAYNLRFPGQVFDGQAGIHQNSFRDYDPAVGRYAESDPIGLSGGVNSYLYVAADPLIYVDSTGLSPMSIGDVMQLILNNNQSNLSAQLLLCLIYKESTLDPSTKNPIPGNTAWGLMGITQGVTDDLGLNHDDMLDPAQNIQAGSKYLNRRVNWKKPFGGAGDVSIGLSKYGTGKAYADSILECEKCLKAQKPCGDNPGTQKCLKALHGGK
jgi:RHS repeat-associated protein